MELFHFPADAKILSFQNAGAVEVAYVDKDGAFHCKDLGALIQWLASIVTERDQLAVENAQLRAQLAERR